jgi:hypothetical protein
MGRTDQSAQMTDMPPYPESSGDAGDDIGTPRWVYGFGILAIALILLFVILHLAGMGPGGHTP